MTPLPLQTQPAHPGEVENETGGRYSNKEHCRVPMTLPQHWDIVLRLNLCHQKDRKRERERLWDGGLRARGLRCQLSLSLTLSLSCGSSKQPLRGRLRGWCLTSQPENGPCPFLPCSIFFPSCLSFVMDTACTKKSQHIYGVADLAGTWVFYLPGTKQLCYSLRIHKPAQWQKGPFLKSGECFWACTYCRRVCV